ncbi:MAG: cytochrome c3 family protein, partial [Polyangiales bacterium]
MDLGRTVATGPGGRPAVSSNVLFEDYAGSQACEPCHEEIVRRFADSPMHRMTRDAEHTDVQGPFDGGRLRIGDDVATMRTVDGRRYLHLRSEERGNRLYRVTHVIGGRYREDYVGIRVAGTGARDRPLAEPPTRLILPVSWIRSDREWRYKGYSVQVPERPGMKAGPEWNRTCIFCHNTVPYLSLVLDDLGDHDVGYQGSTTSNLLPEDRRLRYEVRDPDGLSSALVDEIERLGGEARRWRSADFLLRQATYATKDRFRGRHLVELGIGCESCHGGARQHVETPSKLPSYRPRSSLFTVEAERGELGRAGAINHTCARCHSVLFSRYPYTWEGGTRDRHPRGSTINSGEARNFLLGGCARAMTCTTCHDPHGEDDPEHLERLATPAGNATCTQCHESLAGEEALRRHSHHDPGGAGGSCVACHMPRKNAGLDYALTRYHRIGSPTDAERVEGDRPLECALCHQGKSVEELVTTMERWWGADYDR